MIIISNYIKPFLKWVGGKGQLLPEIKKYYPFDGEKITKYVEPFVGGGAVLFDILNKYDLGKVYVNDANQNLINTYIVVKHNVDELITRLRQIQIDYLSLTYDERKRYYIQKRSEFNQLKLGKSQSSDIDKAVLMIFLNKTCFNGLFRVNKKGLFNVPMGAYKKPMICDESNLRAVSEKLQRVAIVCGDYSEMIDFIDDNTFVYLDPPYRPLTNTSKFTSYTKEQFNDEQQEALAVFVNDICNKGAMVLMSNSDTPDNFFYKLYSEYIIKRITAKRAINCKANGRGNVSELLISNYDARHI